MDHIRDPGCDAEAQQAAAGVMRYFDTAARHHHADEEASVFPLAEMLLSREDFAEIGASMAQRRGGTRC